MNKTGIILIGGGGHCKSVIDVVEAENKFRIIGILDREENVGKSVLGYPIIGADESIDKWCREGMSFHITLGQIKNWEVRYKIYKRLKALDAILPVICSPSAYVSKHARIEEGAVIMHQAIVNAGAHVGVNCIINNNALIEHDALIGEHSHISTSATINGDCRLGGFCFVGSNSVLIQGISIGENCIIGAGTVVTKSWLKNKTIVGNPGNEIKGA